MIGTVHANPTSRRGAVAAAGAVLLLAGCASGGSNASADATPASAAAQTTAAGTTAAGTTAAGTTAPSGDPAFCTQAAGLDDRVNAAVSNLGDDASIPDAFHQLSAELRAIEPPAAVADDWNAMADGLQRTTDALAGVDITDPSSLSAVNDAAGGLSAASEHVQTYLRDECGISS